MSFPEQKYVDFAEILLTTHPLRNNPMARHSLACDIAAAVDDWMAERMPIPDAVGNKEEEEPEG